MIEAVREQLVQLYLTRAISSSPCSGQVHLCRAPVENIHFFDYQTDDVWCRDFMPIFAASLSVKTAVL